MTDINVALGPRTTRTYGFREKNVTVPLLAQSWLWFWSQLEED